MGLNPMLSCYIVAAGSNMTLDFLMYFQLNDKFLGWVGMLFVGLEYHLESVS